MSQRGLGVIDRALGHGAAGLLGLELLSIQMFFSHEEGILQEKMEAIARSSVSMLSKIKS